MIPPETLEAVVAEVFASTQVIDMHTHLFAPGFGKLGLWGIDHLLTYHYLEAELFRFSPIKPEQYWALNMEQRADLIWKTLFVENTPISEAARGVISDWIQPRPRSNRIGTFSGGRICRNTSRACSGWRESNRW